MNTRLCMRLFPIIHLTQRKTHFSTKTSEVALVLPCGYKKRNKQRDGHISYFSSGPMAPFFKSERFAKFIQLSFNKSPIPGFISKILKVNI